MKSRLNFREIEVFRPYAGEFPEELLLGQGMSEAAIDRWSSSQTVRIAKLEDHVVGIYAMDRDADPLWFNLHGVIVALSRRQRGLGTWLTGHAIGVAESKGGRHLRLPAHGGSGCFIRMGFVPNDDGLRFDLIQE